MRRTKIVAEMQRAADQRRKDKRQKKAPLHKNPLPPIQYWQEGEIIPEDFSPGLLEELRVDGPHRALGVLFIDEYG